MPKLPSIRETGLEIYLENTVNDHNGFGYSDFKKMVKANTDQDGKVHGIASMARSFSVVDSTFQKYLGIYREEQANKK